MNTTTQAIKTLGAYTAGRFDIWALAGPAKAPCRQHVMSELMGKRMPKSASGVEALRSAFYTRLSIQGSHEAAREDAFIEQCKIATAPQP